MGGPNCYIVSYDIMEPKRLRQVHRSLKGFGDPLHYSVFRCNLTDKGLIELMAILTEIIKHDEDRVMIVDLGPAEGRAEERIVFMGVHPPDCQPDAVIA